MTRSATIVNTSNWEGEELKVAYGDKVYYLQPGEQCTINSMRFGDVDDFDHSLNLTAMGKSKNAILDDNGDQILPKVNALWWKVPK